MGKVNSDEPAMIECKDKLLSQQTQINEVVRILFAYIAILVVLFNPIANLFCPLESCPSSVKYVNYAVRRVVLHSCLDAQEIQEEEARASPVIQLRDNLGKTTHPGHWLSILTI